MKLARMPIFTQK